MSFHSCRMLVSCREFMFGSLYFCRIITLGKPFFQNLLLSNLIIMAIFSLRLVTFRELLLLEIYCNIFFVIREDS